MFCDSRNYEFFAVNCVKNEKNLHIIHIMLGMMLRKCQFYIWKRFHIPRKRRKNKFTLVRLHKFICSEKHFIENLKMNFEAYSSNNHFRKKIEPMI